MQTLSRTRIQTVEPGLEEKLSGLRGDLDRLRHQLEEVTRSIACKPTPSPAMGDEGRMHICLVDGQSRPRGVFEMDQSGRVHLEIWNEAGAVVARIGETENGAGEIFVADGNGAPRALMKATDEGGMVTAQSAEGLVQALMLAQASGGTFVATNAHGTPMAEMFGDDKGGTVHIKEPTGRSMAYMSAAAERGVVSVFNEFGDQAAALASDDDGGAVVLFDQDGKLKPNAPNE